MENGYIDYSQKFMDEYYAKIAKEIDGQILSAIIKEAKAFEQYMLSDELFEI